MSNIIDVAATFGKREAVDDSVAYLKEVLLKLPFGPVSDMYEPVVVKALVAAWSSFSGHDDQSTLESKIHRAEDLSWESPVLTFVLERHGGTVNGSSRAELHHWQVNMETCHAKIVKRGRRQLEPMARPLNVGPIAEKVADAIVNQQENEWLVWKSPSRVQVRISRIIPETNLQTTTARRKRFRKALAEVLKPVAWNEVRPNVYERS